MLNGITRHREKQRHWRAWAGTLQDVIRLSERLEELVNSRRQGLLAELGLRDPDLGDASSSEPALTERRDENLKASLIYEFQLEMGYGEGDDVAIGRPEQIIQEIDRRSVELLTIFAETEGAMSFSEELQVALGPSGVELKVGSGDRGWVNQVLVAVTEEVEKGVPGWAWVRRNYGRSAFVAVVLICLAVIVSLLIARHVPRKSEGSFLGITIASVVVLWFIFTGAQLTNRFIDWLFPAFQILPDGGRSSGTRRLAFVGSLLLTICLGVIVNLIT
jgi:hypothetical protein